MDLAIVGSVYRSGSKALSKDIGVRNLVDVSPTLPYIGWTISKENYDKAR